MTNKISKNPQLKKGTKQYQDYLVLLSQKAPLALQNAEKIKTVLDEEIKSFERYQQRRQQDLERQKITKKAIEVQPKEQYESKELPSDDDFDEEKFAARLKQFQTFQSNSSPIPTYPKLDHPASSHTQSPTLITPSLSPKTSLTTDNNASIPKLPPKIALEQTVSTSSSLKTSLEQQQQQQPHHKSIASTEGNKPLKTVFLPSTLPLQFLSISSSNSRSNLETCGILCGSLSLNAFFITTLLIPSQESTPNTCQTLHEEDIFEYVDSHNLFVLGWIHTHPTQSCFLSSVDLHTQNSYQIMLPEALAIVCAVKHGVMGQFRLTDPPGIGVITRCQRSGFHPHEEKNLYRHCESKLGGHVVVKDGLPFEVVDLRKEK